MKSVKANEVNNTHVNIDDLKCSIELASAQIDNVQEFRKIWFNRIIQAFAKGEALDPRNSDRTCPLDTFYQYVYRRFLDRRLEDVAMHMLIEIWHELHMIQKNENIPIYDLDALAATLSDAFDSIGDKAAAMRWGLALVAYEAFCYEGLPRPERVRILERYGVPSDALKKLEIIASNNRRVVADAEDWSIPEAFPEDAVTKFLAVSRQYDVLFARHTSTLDEFPLSTVYFGSLLEKVQTAENSVEKGKTLEDLATYLTLLIPGWIPRRNVRTVYNEFESDIIVSNLIQAADLNVERFGRDFLVECKNWSASVGVNDVGYFLFRMRLTDTRFGILFASNGITGDSEKPEDRDTVRRAAKSLIQRASDKDGIVCIVLTAEDLKLLKDGQSFWGMIADKAQELRHGKSYYTPS